MTQTISRPKPVAATVRGKIVAIGVDYSARVKIDGGSSPGDISNGGKVTIKRPDGRIPKGRLIDPNNYGTRREGCAQKPYLGMRVQVRLKGHRQQQPGVPWEVECWSVEGSEN